MRDSLKHVLKLAFDAYAVSERVNWLVEWPGQVVICVGSMYWTSEVGEAIRSNSMVDLNIVLVAIRWPLIDNRGRSSLPGIGRNPPRSLCRFDGLSSCAY
eukprot:scaffold58994_cov29-Prasinocladus_malaysianus.AAC.1